MSRCRVDLINKAFAKMDVTGDEVITAEDLKRTYDVTQHPKFKTGEWSRDRILKEFLDTFQLGEKDDVVSALCTCTKYILYHGLINLPVFTMLSNSGVTRVFLVVSTVLSFICRWCIVACDVEKPFNRNELYTTQLR